MIGGLLDNPLLVKHARSQLRRPHLVAFTSVLLLSCLCVIGGRFVDQRLSPDVALIVLLTVQGCLLVVMGTVRVAEAVGRASSSKTPTTMAGVSSFEDNP